LRAGASTTATDAPDHAHVTALSGPTGNGNGASTPIPLVPLSIAFNLIVKAA